MTVSISKEQLLANRKNAKKSNGPKTGPGTSRATGNLLKHGLWAKEVVIQRGQGAEPRALFNALLAALCDELQPQDIVEEILVERIAVCYWRIRRALRYEVGTIRDALDQCRSDTDDTELRRLRKRMLRAEECLSYEQRAMRALDKPPDLSDPRILDLLRPALDQLAANHDLPPLPPSRALGSPIASLPSDRPCQAQSSEGKSGHQQPSLLHNLAQVGLTAQKLHDALRAAQRRIVDQCTAEADDWCQKVATAYDEWELRRDRRVLAGCLPDDDRVLRLVRYETMLDCQLHRALAQLRRRKDRTPSTPQPSRNADSCT